MKIRSISLGIENSSIGENQNNILAFFDVANDTLKQADFDVRTNRLNLSPLHLSNSNVYRDMMSLVSWISDFCQKNNIEWFCTPFDTFGQDMKEVNAFAVESVKRHKNVFINYIIAKDGLLNRNSALYASKLIKSVSRLSNNGYDNFRVGASFNCKPNCPFFPFTYHHGEPGFSIALELVPLFIQAITNSDLGDFEQIHGNLVKLIVPFLKQVNASCLEIEKKTKMVYYGIDASLAPFPDADENSVARAIELLGIDAFGSFGTVFLTSFLTDVIKKMVQDSKIRTVGFNGVMYSLLEDTRLGINSKSKEFSIDSILAYSSVCGCGIDMVPIPGDVFEEEIASLMLDVSAISSVRNKPLGFRVLPIPTKQANEYTEFSYDFLHNTRIKKVKNKSCFNVSFENTSSFKYSDVSL